MPLVTPDDGPLLPSLPVRVQPAAGEIAESHIRHLAQANHLRPSLLQVYVRNPDVAKPGCSASSATTPPAAACPSGRSPAAAHIQRRMVRQALADPAGPPPRKRGTRSAPAIGPIQDVLDKLAGEPLTVWEICTTVTGQHDSDASYAAVRDHIRSRRLSGQPGPPRGQITTDDQVQPRLRG